MDDAQFYAVGEFPEDPGFEGEVLDIHPLRRVEDDAEASLLLVRPLRGRLVPGAAARVSLPSGRVRALQLDGVGPVVPGWPLGPYAAEAARLLRVVAAGLEPETLADRVRLVQDPGGDAPPADGDAAGQVATLRAAAEQRAEVRYAALQALAALESDAPLEPLLLATLDDENREVRWLAADALSALGSRAPLAPFLAGIADKSTENQGLRRAAARVLAAHAAEWPEERLFAALVELMRDPNDVAVALAATDALARLGARAPVEALVQALRRWEGSPSRAVVAHALARLGERAPLASLIAALDDPDLWARRGVARALLTLGERLPAAARARVERILAEEAASSRRMSEMEAERLAPWRQAIEPPTREAYLAALAAPERERRASALRGLGELEDPPLDALLAALADEDANVRVAAAEALGELGGRGRLDGPMAARAAESLFARLDDGVDDVESAAEYAIADLAPWLPLDLLAQHTGDAGWRARYVVVKALAARGAEAPPEPLIAATTDGARFIREDALRALREAHPDAFARVAAEAEAVLLGRPAGPVLDALVQCELAWQIGRRRLTSEAAIGALRELLVWPHPTVRLSAIRALEDVWQAGASLAPDVAERLRELTHDPTSHSVRDAARDLLARLESGPTSLPDPRGGPGEGPAVAWSEGEQADTGGE